MPLIVNSISFLTSFEVWTSTLYFIERDNASDFSNTRGHQLSDNHVKTDIFPHNNYSAAEVQQPASYPAFMLHLDTKLISFPIMLHPVQHIMLLNPMPTRIPMIGFYECNHLLPLGLPLLFLSHYPIGIKK